MPRLVHLFATLSTFSSSVLALAGCDPYDPDLGDRPFQCGADDQCPDGYTCDKAQDVCVSDDDAPTDDGMRQCADEALIEPNDEPRTAFYTPVGESENSYTLDSLSMCPPGDRDYFRFAVPTAGLNFEAEVVGERGRSPLELDLLTEAGVAAGGVGEPVDGSPETIRIEIPNRLAAMAYVLRVRSPDDTESSYSLRIRLCATPLPCPP